MINKKRQLVLDGAVMNRGDGFTHPLESQYAVARRILVANPVLSLQKFRRLYLHPMSHSKIDSLSHLMCEDDPLSLKGAVRQCFLCARDLFHPTAYGLAAIKLCPVHNVPLSEKCPDCGMPWKRSLIARKPECKTCGIPSHKTLGQMWKKKRIYRDLQWLSDWLVACSSANRKLCRPTLRDIYQELRPSTGIERSILKRPTFLHPFFPGFESAKYGGQSNRRLTRLNITTFDQPVKTRFSRLKFWDPLDRPEPSHGCDFMPRYRAPADLLETLIGLALRHILRWHDRLLGQQHRLNWFDMRAIRPDQVAGPDCPCILCMAFSLWCNAIVLKFLDPTFAGQPAEFELLRFVHYRKYPILPQGVYAEATERRFFRPTTSFDRWLFLRSSSVAFSEFVRLSLWIYQRAALPGIKYRQTDYSEKHRFPYPFQPSELLEISQHKTFLRADFIDQPPLTDTNLDPDQVQECLKCRQQSTRNSELLWSVDASPSDFRRSHVKELINTVNSGKHLSRSHYPWTRRAYLNALGSQEMIVFRGFSNFYEPGQEEAHTVRLTDLHELFR